MPQDAATPILALWPWDGSQELAARTDAIVKRTVAQSDRLFDTLPCAGLAPQDFAAAMTGRFRHLISLTAVDTTLHSVAVLPLFHADFGRMLESVRCACAACEGRVSLHVVALRASLASLFGADAGDTAAAAAAERQAMALLAAPPTADRSRVDFSVTVIDNYAANGAPFNFTPGAFAEYLAMMFGALMRSYRAVMHPALLAGAQDGCVAMGFASVRFDAAGAAGYLTNRAFMKALDVAGITHTTVDAAMASNEAMSQLRGIDTRYGRFYASVVLPMLRDDKVPEAEIAGRLAAPLDREFAGMENALAALLRDTRFSFPEREAVLALMLGRDNPRLRGVHYDCDTLLLDDGIAEPLNLFLDAFNSELSSAAGLPRRGEYPLLKKYEWNAESREFVESDENRLAFNPLPHIKRLKREILDNTAFIRRKTDELRQLLEADDARRRSESDAAGGDTPGHRRDREPVREQPLDKAYTPPAGFRPKESVDLRPFFSPVKNQGELGSCSTFASVAMYEAMMNRCDPGRAADADMSERFVYYHSNVLQGRPEGGSNYFDQLAVLGKHGVCAENLFGYSTVDLHKEPSDEAVADAMTHRVLSAEQLVLRSGGSAADALAANHRLITSALSEGFPVGIALKIYDNFGVGSPYINRPDADDVASGGEGYHAMVAVGYSEAEKCYIVRNSWGKGFGDNGYCYISAAYVDDAEFNNFACIIRETTDCGKGRGAEVPGMVAGFAGTQTQINIAAIRNILDEARVILRSQQAEYDEYYRYYRHLVQRLCMPQVRNTLRLEAESRAAVRFAELSAMREATENDFAPGMRQFRSRYLTRTAYYTAAVVAADAVALYAMWHGVWGLDNYVANTVLGAANVIAAGLWLNYRWAVRRRRREQQERLDALYAATERARREWLEKQLSFHVAGMWLDRFHNLSISLEKTYDRLVSFNANLLAWYREDEKEAATVPCREAAMIKYVEDRDLLDAFFSANSGQVVAAIDLADVFEKYNISTDSIQESRAGLRAGTTAAISAMFADFSMADYLTGHRTYAYMPPVSLERVVTEMLGLGQPSVRHSGHDAAMPARMLFFEIDPREMSRWQQAADGLFPLRPTPVPVQGPFVLDMATLLPLPYGQLR
ncbi:MAG: C1 family peptidase [Muribaculaceae bacterium]|nr:C1 family peptidase [Muribaculaceae bacterium]